MASDMTLPEPLPADPMTLFQEWFREAAARRAQPNPDAMIVATSASNGDPSARVVLCKRVGDAGYVVFFTNYESRKGRELAQRPRAAAVFHWDALHRQVRIEGPIVRSPDAESDQYFASRALDSRIARMCQRAKRAAGIARNSAATRARASGALRPRSRHHERHRAEATALGRLSSVDREDRALVRGREPRARQSRVGATAATSGRVHVRRRAMAQHSPESLRHARLLDDLQRRLGALVFAGRRGRLGRRSWRLRRCIGFRKDHPLPRLARVDAEHRDDRHAHVVSRGAEARAKAHDSRCRGSACWWRWC